MPACNCSPDSILAALWHGGVLVLCVFATEIQAQPSAAAPRGRGLQQVANIAESGESADQLKLVMDQWTAAAREINTLQTRFVRQEFDSEHAVETRGQGRIQYEADGRAMYVLEPYPVQPNQRSTRATNRGVPFRLEVPKAETLYWIQGQIARINPRTREFELFEVPEQFWTPGVVEATESFDVLWTTLGCLERHVPGLIESDLADLQARFEWSLLSVDPDKVVLTAKPLTAADQRHYSAVHVYVDSKTYLTRGTKTVNSTGTREVVHTFADTKVNLVAPANAPDWAPDIGRMRLLTPPPLAPPADE